MTKELKTPRRTRRVMVGMPVGGGAPVAVQSMLNAPADDVAANPRKLEALPRPAEIVRMAIPVGTAWTLSKPCAASPLCLVADIHFDALSPSRRRLEGRPSLRINPGNIGGLRPPAR